MCPLGEGFGVGFRWAVGGGFPLENKGKSCDSSRHLQESLDPPGPKSQSLKKSLFGGPQKSLKKYPKKSTNTDFRRKSVFVDFFGYFLRLFCGPPKRLFLDFFAISGPEGPETPVNGGSGRKEKGAVGTAGKGTRAQVNAHVFVSITL